MSQTHLDVSIAVLPESVWPWLIEPEKMVQWLKPLESVELQTPPPLDTGSRYLLVAPYGHHVHVFEGVVQAYEPFNRLAIRIGGGAFPAGVTATAAIELTLQSTVTQLDLVIRVDGLRGLKRLAAPLGMGIARCEALLRLNTLKRVLEELGPGEIG